MSYKHNPDGSQSPYELNVNYFDALSDPHSGEPQSVQVARFLAAHAIMLSLAGLPGIKSATSGVPIQGGLNASMSMTLPHGRWKEADGEIRLACSGCVFGDGVSKMMPRAMGGRPTNAFTEQGVTVPPLRMGEFEGLITVKKGQGKIDKFQAKSPDGELYLDGDIRFEDPFVKSTVTAYMRFKANDELVKREERMGDIINMMKGQALSMQLGFSHASEWDVSLIVRNLFDKRGVNWISGLASDYGTLFGDPRYRVPAMPFLVVLAAAAGDAAVGVLRRDRA